MRSHSDIKKFKEVVWNYYSEHKRMMPWRETSDPYHILVSEIMLQQTQVGRVLIMYPKFIKALPSFKHLVKAPLSRVLNVWQGMGYNRRAIALKKIAEKVMREYGGVLPRDVEILKTFSGIGKATAGSIGAFAFNMPTIFIETNIRRVFIYHFFPHKEKVSDEEILKYIATTVDTKNPREWYWALMDYGTHLGQVMKKNNPNKKIKEYHLQSKF